MSNQAKDIRKQVRNVVQEILAETLSNEVVAAMEIRIMTYLKKRLNEIDDRQKDIQSYMVRQAASKIQVDTKKD